MTLYLSGNGLYSLRILTKGNAALFYIGTGDIDFQHIHIRVSKAFRDLLETDYSVLEIAMRNGFSDTRSLINVFRDTYGMTPSQYRKKNARREAAKEAASAEYPPHIRVVDAP